MRTPNSAEELAAVQRAAAQRHLVRRLLTELLVFVVLIIPICIFEFVIEPTTRGFFCDDETLHYPFQPNTVTPVMLGLLVGVLPLLIVAIVECVRYKQSHDMYTTTHGCRQWRLPAWSVEIGRQVIYFTFGLLITLNATEVGKYTIGRLRPHFMAVCQPQLTDGSTCSESKNEHRYVENYVCTGEGYTYADIRQARLSFPSGHSSLACFAMLYAALYLQRRLRWRGSKLARHAVQFVLVMLAWFTALSRVMDNWHHWSDVLVGTLIGALCALITAVYIAKLFAAEYSALSLDVSRVDVRRSGSVVGEGVGVVGCLQRQDTTATLHEVCTSSTPPPYITEQYTKV